MTQADMPPQRTAGSGFWRLQHDHLAALLARHDLGGEQLRVYLALADLTVGYGHERDIVSLGQIAEHAGGLRRPNVVRALGTLGRLGLYGQASANGQQVSRWVTWPPPPVLAHENTTPPVLLGENSAVLLEENTRSPGREQNCSPGRDTPRKKTTTKKVKKHAAATPPPDSRVKTFIDWFSTAYKTATGNRYIVSGGKDGATVKRLLRNLDGDGQDPVGVLQAAAAAMLADPWGRERASIGLLAAQINQWRKGPSGSRGTFTPAKAGGEYSNLSREYE